MIQSGVYNPSHGPLALQNRSADSLIMKTTPTKTDFISAPLARNMKTRSGDLMRTRLEHIAFFRS